MIPIAKSRFLVLKKGPLLMDFEIFRETESPKPEEQQAQTGEPAAERNPVALVAEEDPLASAHVQKITTLEESPYIILKVKQDRQSYYLLADLEAKTPVIKDLSDLI